MYILLAAPYIYASYYLVLNHCTLQMSNQSSGFGGCCGVLRLLVRVYIYKGVLHICILPDINIMQARRKMHTDRMNQYGSSQLSEFVFRPYHSIHASKIHVTFASSPLSSISCVHY